MVERFGTALDCVDVGFLPDRTLDRLPLSSQIGRTRVGGVDLNKPRIRAALAAVLALSASPAGFTVADLTRKVHAMTGQTPEGYTSRQAAYDLRKLRGKDLVSKPVRSRRYLTPPAAARTITALLTLRDQVIGPILAGVRSPRLGAKPAARAGGDAQLGEARARVQEASEQPRPASLAGVRLRDVAEQLIAALREAAGETDARVTALLEQLSGIEDLDEAMEAELAALRAEAVARDAELEARLARTKAELGIERRRAEDASRAAEAGEELTEALRAQVAGLEQTVARVEGELVATRVEADTATGQAAERQARLQELTDALAAESRRREELDGQTTLLRRERNELAAGLAAAGERAAAAEARADGLNQKLIEALAAARTAEAAGERAERLAHAREQQADQAATAQRGAERRAEAAERVTERAEARAEAAERRASDARAEATKVREQSERAGQELAAARAIVDELRRRATAEVDLARTRESTGGPTEAAASSRTRPPKSAPLSQPSTSGQTPARARRWAEIPEARIGRYTVCPGSPVRVQGLRGVHRVVRIEQHTVDGRVNVEISQPGGRPTRSFPADSVRYVQPSSKAAKSGIQDEPTAGES